MDKTEQPVIPFDGRVLITTDELQQILSLSRRPAIRVGMEAGARRQYGRAVRWSLDRVREYMYGKEEA